MFDLDLKDLIIIFLCASIFANCLVKWANKPVVEKPAPRAEDYPTVPGWDGYHSRVDDPIDYSPYSEDLL